MGKVKRKKLTTLPIRRNNSHLIGNKYAVGKGRPVEWTPELIEIEREALETWIDDPKNYFITAFLNERKLDAKLIDRFTQSSQSFCQTYTRAKQIQEQRLVEAACTRKFDGNFVKFVLQNKAGWKEKQELSGDTQNPLAILMAKIDANAKSPVEDYEQDG